MSEIYPEAIFEPRIVENVPGEIYDPERLTRLYAEDINFLAQQLVAVQVTLGLLPAGADMTVGNRIESVEILTQTNSEAINTLENSFGNPPALSNGFSNLEARLASGQLEPVLPISFSNLYIMPGYSYGGVSNLQMTAGRLYYYPIVVDRDMTFDRVALNVQTAGAGLIRIGLYQSFNKQLTSLFWDFGTVSASPTGVKEITGDWFLPPGLYFVAFVVGVNCGLTCPNFSTTERCPLYGLAPTANLAQIPATFYVPGQSSLIVDGLPNAPVQPTVIEYRMNCPVKFRTSVTI